MANIDPVRRLYTDLTTILHSLVIKYPNLAEEYETVETKSLGDRYLLAYYMRDTWYMYDDYSIEDYMGIGIDDEDTLIAYVNDRNLLEPKRRPALVKVRRERALKEYVEQNNYYRMLNGYPDIEDTDFFYLPKDLAEELLVPEDLPLHKISEEMGNYYIAILQARGYIDQLYKENPEKEYLLHLGANRISIHAARTAKPFGILALRQDTVMESTYREFVRCYERARNYFMSVIYVYQYRKLIPYYDNFIALCIFVMTVQQVSMNGIRNTMDREFYDEYMVRLIYETYKVPFFSRIDEATQKLIVQNLNLLVQNKATNKVFLDIASILGFNEINIYQYYLVKDRKFDKEGNPIFKKKTQININTGKEEEVYDFESMYGVHFQKVDIREENVKGALTNSLNRVEYYDLTYYDPLWWEDDELHEEVWETTYNYMETKYFGVTIPYRLTELLLQSDILLRMIIEKAPELQNVGVQLPKITTREIQISLVVVLFLALASKKMKVSGQITTLPSKLIHILEITDQEINKTSEPMEVLQFDFEAFSPAKIKETIDILRGFLRRREYRVINGHDIDLREDGTQDTFAPTHERQWSINEEDLDELESYINQLIIPNGDKAMKVEALNKIYENIEAIYYFLSYQMSLTTDMNEYEALKKFYDVIFYTRETAESYKIVDEDGQERCAETFMEYLYYKDIDLYEFVENVREDEIYTYMDHIIYKLEEYIHHLDYLYVMNNEMSPLAELLQILLDFFKSYILDFVQMTSLMIVDWDMENTIRFWDAPHNVYKKNQVEDLFFKAYSDVIHKFIAHIRIEDRIKLEEYLRCHAHIRLSDEIFFDDRPEFLVFTKTNKISDRIEIGDDGLNHVKTHMNGESSFHLEDTLVKLPK